MSKCLETTDSSGNRAVMPKRNDPCPCGSGRKYKKCCERVHERGQNRYEIMKNIAYLSAIGRRRETFCVEMAHRLQIYHREAAAFLQKQAASLGRPLTCHKRCSLCCTQYVWTTLSEADAIVYYLYRNPDVLSFFITRYQVWKTWPGRREADQAVCLTFSGWNDSALFERALNLYNSLENPCPFLKDGECAIYPVRPLACGSIGSISPASYCRGSSDEHPFYGFAPVLDFRGPAYLWEHDLQTVGGMPQMVNRLLTGGFIYIMDAVGSERLVREVWSDPALRRVLSKYRRPAL